MTFFRYSHKPWGANQDSNVDIGQFLGNFKKGSKPIRRIFEKKRNVNTKLSDSQSVMTYYRLTGLLIEDEDSLRFFYSSWNCSTVPGLMREFMFRFLNNSLAINTRVSHYVENVDRSCTFCKIKNVRPIHEESFIHLFYECETTAKAMGDFINEYLPEFINNTSFRKKHFFLAFKQNNAELDNVFIYWGKWTLLYLIWDCKLKKRQCTWQSMKRDFGYILGQICCNKKIGEKRRNSNTYLARNWDIIFSDAFH